MTGEIIFRFEGREVVARAGQSVAAALTGVGIRAFRETVSGDRRGMFCGMGVCQECLVDIDGTPGQRACMTGAQAGMTVVRQPALTPFGATTSTDRRSGETSPDAQTLTPDVLVVGAGAGGLNAAAVAAGTGADVLVVDERRVPGGQYFKQTAAGLADAPLDTQQAAGRDLAERARSAGAQILHGVELWGAFDGPLFVGTKDRQALVLRPKTTIVATGAYERPRMVPGWELPGVMTTGAAQTLWRSYRTLPGRRVAVFGSGPLNFQVALELARGGADIVHVAEAGPSPWKRFAAIARMFAADPALAARGAAMLVALAARGRTPRFGSVLERVEARGGALVATARSAGGRDLKIEADAVCMNYGFQPQNEILRLLGAAMTYDQAFDQLRPDRSATMETSVKTVFAVGDCCGLGGAPAAEEEGTIAGIAAAAAFGRPVDSTVARTAATRLARHHRFQNALWSLHDVAAPDLATVEPDSLVCRCEEVTRAQIDAALADDPHDIGSVKRATRVGMGRCQGRYCGPALAKYLAHRTGEPLDDYAFFAPRTPVKPVPIEAVLAAQEAMDAAQ